MQKLELQIFDININQVRKEDLANYKPFLLRLFNIIFLRLTSKGIQKPNYFIEREYAYNSAIKNVSNNCFLAGYWQTSLYFQSIDHLIRQDFKFPKLVDQINIDHLKLIESSNSVSLHIRRTDFINNSNHNVHGVCSLEYYHKGVDLISKKIDNPLFFVFSDDVYWAKENLKLNHSVQFVCGNLGKKSYIDMFLMSSCKHNIIANSSFSWWGAWLNCNSDKIVIAPKIWFVKKQLNNQTGDLIPDKWVRL